MYIPYALIYFVDRIYITCRLSSTCAELTICNYLTEEIIVMAFGVLLHIPIWILFLKIADVKKNGGKTRDIFPKKAKTVVTSPPVDECVGEFEDEDVRNEREKVNRLCSSTSLLNSPTVVVVKVRRS